MEDRVMPVYIFNVIKTGQSVERLMTVDELLKCKVAEGQYMLPEGLAVRDHGAEHGGFKHSPGNWPMYSDAAGVHPSQAKQASEDCAAKGVPTRFDSEGRAIFESRGHRKAFLRAHGMVDKSGGYGD
jgi:hypothetical protein